jgi:hypothetical protein
MIITLRYSLAVITLSSQIARPTLGISGVYFKALGHDMSFYHLARRNSDLWYPNELSCKHKQYIMKKHSKMESEIWALLHDKHHIGNNLLHFCMLKVRMVHSKKVLEQYMRKPSQDMTWYLWQPSFDHFTELGHNCAILPFYFMAYGQYGFSLCDVWISDEYVLINKSSATICFCTVYWALYGILIELEFPPFFANNFGPANTFSTTVH